MIFHPPAWVEWSLWAALGLLVVGIPLRLLWRLASKRRADRARLDHVSVRLRDVFNEVAPRRRWLGSPTVDFKHKGRACKLVIHSVKKVDLEVDATPGVPLPVVVRTRRWIQLWPVLHGLESLDQIRTGDPLIDDVLEVHANGIFAAFLQDRLLEQIPIDGPPTGLSESLLVLNSSPGVRKFVLRLFPGKPVSLRMKLRTEDLLFRPEDLEGLIHHIDNLHDVIVNYDRPSLPSPESKKPETETKKKDEGTKKV